MRGRRRTHESEQAGAHHPLDPAQVLRKLQVQVAVPCEPGRVSQAAQFSLHSVRPSALHDGASPLASVMPLLCEPSSAA